MNFWPALGACSTAVGVLGTFFYFVVRLTVRDEIRKINGTYTRSAGSGLTGKQIEDTLNEHHAYMHREVHWLRNKVVGLRALESEEAK